METRQLGDTGHDSSLLTFGAIALDFLDQGEADEMVEAVLDRGVNHVDVAPKYGTAEVKLAPKLGDRRRDESPVPADLSWSLPVCFDRLPTPISPLRRAVVTARDTRSRTVEAP